MSEPPEGGADFEGLERGEPFGAHTLPSLLVVLAIAVAGALLSPILMVWVFQVVDESTPDPQIWQWLFVLGVETGFWALAALPLWLSVRKLWSYVGTYDVEPFKLGLFVLFMLVLAALPLTLAQTLKFFEKALERQFAPLMILVFIGGVVAGLGVVGVWLVDRCVAHRSDPKHGVRLIPTYILLTRYLDAYRSFLGIMLGLVVLAAGAQQAAIVAASQANALETGVATSVDFQPGFVLLFGAYNTILLVLVYVPTYLRLVSTGRRIVDEIQPLPDKVEELDDALTLRATVSTALGFEKSATEKLKSTLFLLVPAFSGIVTALVGTSST